MISEEPLTSSPSIVNNLNETINLDATNNLIDEQQKQGLLKNSPVSQFDSGRNLIQNSIITVKCRFI